MVHLSACYYSTPHSNILFIYDTCLLSLSRAWLEFAVIHFPSLGAHLQHREQNRCCSDKQLQCNDRAVEITLTELKGKLCAVDFQIWGQFSAIKAQGCFTELRVTDRGRENESKTRRIFTAPLTCCASRLQSSDIKQSHVLLIRSKHSDWLISSYLISKQCIRAEMY